MLKQKHIDAARETRLWIGQILIPAATGIILLATNPYVRAAAKNVVSNIKAKFSKRKEADYDQ